MTVLALTQGTPQSQRVQVVAVAQIKTIDVKRNILVIGTVPSLRRGAPLPGIPRIGFPPGRSGGRQQSDTTVVISSNTALKDDKEIIAMSDLRVGDSVQVTGHPLKKDIEATEIIRLRRKTPIKSGPPAATRGSLSMGDI